MNTLFRRCAAVLLAGVIASQTAVPAYAAETEQSVRDELTRWIIGTSAILNIQNRNDHRRFESDYIEEADRERSRIGLRSSWNTENADDLRDRIANLMQGTGHHQNFMRRFAAYSAVEGALENIPEESRFAENSRELVLYVGDKWGERGIIGWDLVRVGTLVDMGFAAGYIDREEAFLLMEPAANMLRFLFDDWDEALENYLDGTGVFWAGITPTMGATHRLVANRHLSYLRLRLDYYRRGAYDILPFDDSFFWRTPTVNLERTILPTPELLRGYWFAELDSSLWVVERYFGEDGRVLTVFGNHDGEALMFSGAYSFDDNGMLNIAYYNIDIGYGPEEIEVDWMTRVAAFFFFTGTGGSLVAISPIDGHVTTHERGDGRLVAPFRQGVGETE
ncbi:MAG: DUF1266 domain-containing protein [Defluviitaleaceae bacterium]|nr:DUF1266 domain-containing protein [Defluviitaleaceae bacterium]